MSVVTFQENYSIKITQSNFKEDGVEVVEKSSSTIKFRPYSTDGAYEMNYNDSSYLLLLKSNSANNMTEFSISSFGNVAPISRGTLVVQKKSSAGAVLEFKFTNTFKESNTDPTISSEVVYGYIPSTTSTIPSTN